MFVISTFDNNLYAAVKGILLGTYFLRCVINQEFTLLKNKYCKKYETCYIVSLSKEFIWRNNLFG